MTVHLRRLRIATLAVWVVFAMWVAVDHAAVAAGRRSLAVALFNVFAALLLFSTISIRVIASSPQSRPARDLHGQTSRSPSAPALYSYLGSSNRRAAHVIVGALLAIGILALVGSSNDFGYRLKGAVMVVAGACFYALGLVLLRSTRVRTALSVSGGEVSTDAKAMSRARRVLVETLVYVGVLELASVMTLTLDWTAPSNRWLGIGSQVTAAVVGLIGCARFLAWDRDNYGDPSLPAQ